GEGLDDLVAFVEHKTARRPAITGCTGELDVSYVARDMNEDGLNLHVVHEVVDLVDLVTALAQGGDGAVGIARLGEANFCRDAHVFSSCAKRKSGPSSVTWQSEFSTAPTSAMVPHCTRRTDAYAERGERSALPSATLGIECVRFSSALISRDRFRIASGQSARASPRPRCRRS